MTHPSPLASGSCVFAAQRTSLAAAGAVSPPSAASSTHPSCSSLQTFCPFLLNHLRVLWFQHEGWDLLAILSRVLGPQGCPGEEEIPGWKQQEEERQRMLSLCHHWFVQCQRLSSKLPPHPVTSRHRGTPGEFSTPWDGVGMQLAGGQQFTAKLNSRTYHQVQLLLVPRVKASLLTACLLHAQGLHQVDANLTSLPANTLLQGSLEKTEIIQNTKIEHYLFLLKFAQSLVSPGQIAEIQIVLIY